MMRTKDDGTRPDHPDSPSVWAVRFLVATDKGNVVEAREAADRLRELGWKIVPVKRGVPA